MKWVIIILIVLAVLLAAALIYTAMKRKKNEVARQRAGELRSEAATSAVAKQEQEARAREAEAEAERARAQADKLDARAQSERTSYDQTRAAQEDRLREADRLDPDVDHRDPNYTPGAGATPGEHGEHTQGEHTGGQYEDQQTGGQYTEGRGEHAHPDHTSGNANPVPPGPETTTAPEEPRRDQI